MKPLVTIVCVSYNHAPFIKEALQSVFNQSYAELQVIVMDDGSEDESQLIIKDFLADKEVDFIAHKENLGYTKTFNEGLEKAKGEYIIDFALDDVMSPEFVEKSVEALERAGPETGVIFSNADYTDEDSKVIGNHNEILFKKKMIDEVPSGDIFRMVLRRYFICTPTMVIRKEVFDRLGGYDEELAYEDFDFWVRSSRYWKYAFLDEVLMQKRKLDTSMSAQRLKHRQNEQQKSVLKVCKKAFQICKTKDEFKALNERLNYEYRQCQKSGNQELLPEYKALIKDSGGHVSLASRFSKLFS